ncbi:MULTISPECIES: FecR family protein [Butyricimonas]|uniref:FecR family protein n=1 Tax=Butyricimonas TaxID=574697 RepID=UPI0013A612EE|nr:MULTISPECIES: FecR family protein [Butyricimonas]
MKDNTISASLIYRKIEGKLSVVEEERFEAWLKEGQEHREYYERMRRMYQQENVQDVGIGGIQDVWAVFEKRVQGQRKIERKRRWMWVMSAAAAVAIVLCCCLFVYYRANTEQKVNVAVQKIVPGQYNAVLEMADGSTYQLGEQQYSLQEKTGNQIKVDSTLLSYLPVNKRSDVLQDIVYNKLSVPKGGEYRIELEDGTKVWINSASRLRYPVVFSSNSREVYLEGEAYFEVQRDVDRPFIVHSGEQKVTVLGTSFGISCYASEANDYTTLVSGKVKVDFERGKQSFMLEPGMQVAYNKESGIAIEKKVDVAEFVAWKNGKYIFNQKRLEDILSTLSRWYDFEVFYRNEDVKEVLFSGELRRFDDFSYLLRLIERTSDVKFVIDKKVVQVMR